MQQLEFKPTYKNKQRFKKFFFSLKIRGLTYSTFSPKTFLRSSQFDLKTFHARTRFTTNFFSRSLLLKNQRQLFRLSLKSETYFFVNQSTIFGIKRLLAPLVRGKKLKSSSKIFFPFFSSFNFTKKPLTVRIGGGVGKKIRKTGFFVRPGSEIIVVYSKTPWLFQNKLLNFRKKFSKKVRLFVV
jgi:hypothetical protein